MDDGRDFDLLNTHTHGSRWTMVVVYRVFRAYGPIVRDWRVAKYMLTFAAVVVVGTDIYMYMIFVIR